jgi:hypothetical protein
MLAEWPTPERSALEWDEAAASISGRLAQPAKTRDAIPDDALLAAPLPAEPGEGSSGFDRAAAAVAVENKMGNSQDPKSKRSSFAELAKLAGSPSLTPAPPSTGVTRAAEGSKDDSGIVDLKIIASLDPGAAERAKTAALASDGLFDDEPAKAADASPVVASSAPPPVSSAAPPPVSAPPPAAVTPSVAPTASAPPPSAAPVATPSAAPPAPVGAVPAPIAAKKKEDGGSGGIVIVLGGLLAASAIAAGVFFYVRSQGDLPALKKSEPIPDPVVKVAPPPATTEAPAATATASAIAVTEPPPVDTAPVPDKPGAVVPKPTTPAGGGGGGGGGVAAKPSAAPPDPKLQVKELAGGPPSGSGDDLASAMQKAAGGPLQQAQDKTQQTPAIPANAPQKPSQGQVAGAIGSVLPEARACLGPDDPVGTATVVFQSDGTVQSVSVSSKVGADCIKSALSKAKVPPFHEPTFSFPVKVRPNG